MFKYVRKNKSSKKNEIILEIFANPPDFKNPEDFRIKQNPIIGL